MRSGQAYIDASCETVPVGFDTLLTWDYSHEDPALVRLYERAKKAQWNAAADIDWSVEVDPLHVSREQLALLAADPHSPFARLDQSDLAQLAWESQAWTVSQFLHGEQGALLATAKIVDCAPDSDAKLYAATQVVDEARHVEVYDRYLHSKLERVYPINPYLDALIRDLLADARWDMTYLGMQIMIESLALAAFGFIYQTTEEPLLREITFRVMGDEARHVAFGLASLRGLYGDMAEGERRDREDFVCDAAALMRDRFLQREVWEHFGLPPAECEAYVRDNPVQQQFRAMLFSKVVPHVKRIGLLTPYVRGRFEALGILQFESEPVTVGLEP